MYNAKRALVFALVCAISWAALSPLRAVLHAQQSPVHKPTPTVAPVQPSDSQLTIVEDSSPPYSGPPTDAQVDLISASAVGANGTIHVTMNTNVTENVGGYTYIWVVNLTGPDGTDHGTQYFDNLAASPPLGNPVSVSLDTTFPDPGDGTAVTVCLMRVTPQTSADAHTGITAAQSYAAYSGGMTSPFQQTNQW